MHYSALGKHPAHSSFLAPQEHWHEALQINNLGMRISFIQPTPGHQNMLHARQSSLRVTASEPAQLLGMFIWKRLVEISLHRGEKQC